MNLQIGQRWYIKYNSSEYIGEIAQLPECNCQKNECYHTVKTKIIQSIRDYTDTNYTPFWWRSRFEKDGKNSDRHFQNFKYFSNQDKIES